MEVLESLIEMHFHQALIDLIADHYSAESVEFYKPSQQQERWVGFDQAFVVPKDKVLTTDELVDHIFNASQGGAVNLLAFAYLLQFKAVKRLVAWSGPNTKRKLAIQKAVNSVLPYYRAELDLDAPKVASKQQLAQHELLWALASNAKLDVHYACGMVFERSEVWKKPDLDLLRIVPVSSAPGPFAQGQTHDIVFSTLGATPIWMSEPHEGVSLPPREWVQGRLKAVQNREAFVGMITEVREVMGRAGRDDFPEALTIVLLHLPSPEEE